MTKVPLKMRRNCCSSNLLELRLLPPDFPVDNNQIQYHPISKQEASINTGQRQLTIFYNGKVCVCDATEFEARAIILLAAKREMEERNNNENGSEEESPSSSSSSPSSQMLLSTGAPSFKRSLQRFLQKRNHRIHQASSPYHR